MSTLPLAVDGHHVLAVPDTTDLLTLAAAWFAQADWLTAPVTASQARSRARPMSGARFRGMVADPEPQPGELRLTWEVSARGPYPLAADAAHALGLPARSYDLYAVVPGDDPSRPVTDPGVLAWMSAAARRSAGAILPADRTHPVVPDPRSSVDLTLWSAVALAPEAAVPLVRPLLSGSRVVVSAGLPPQPGDSRGDDGPGSATAPAPYELVATYSYDGEVRLRFARSSEVPVVLTALDWREYGPFAYRVSWLPPEEAEYRGDSVTPLHAIARARIAPYVARAVAALARAAGGAVVDSDGYLVDDAELTARAASTSR
ncbi:hypothetical protein AB6N24_07375 [Cellulomonas sp. 179-A 4D5 NHS]|uniref:hypothetical protein n=1 Tax=Cellulomonas sp. 179-A 4D5 NHS TaxID=3142378 RepID=UPI0039A1B908